MKPEKLRFALTQAFLATVTYGACARGAGITAFQVRQWFLEYRARASASDLNAQLALGRIFSFVLNADMEALRVSGAKLDHDKFYVEVAYDLTSVYRFFYRDVEQRTAYTSAEIDRVGRDARIALLDPQSMNAVPRRRALNDDGIWASLNACGNVAQFQTLPGLAKLPPPAIQAIAADWTDIRWWSDALQGLTPKLTSVLLASARSTSANIKDDHALMTAHEQLRSALARLTSKTNSAFNDGWPIAVMYRLATQSASGATDAESTIPVEVDLSINGKSQRQTTDHALAHAQTAAG